MKRPYLLVIMLVPALWLSSCSTHLGLSRLLGGGSSKSGGGTAAPKASHAASQSGDYVLIANTHYRPKNMTIAAGKTITWTNNDTVPESVTSDTPGLFDSGPLNPGATFVHTFAQTGVFPYHSTAVSSLYGSITVTP